MQRTEAHNEGRIMKAEDYNNIPQFEQISDEGHLNQLEQPYRLVEGKEANRSVQHSSYN